MPKRSVLDPQGKAVEHAMHTLGLPEAEGVRIGKRIEFTVADKDSPELRAKINQLGHDLLANPVIEDYAVAYE